jgi:hypothetical protein
VRSKAITTSNMGTAVKILEIPAKTFIPPRGVVILVETLFGGGTPSIIVGDADDADGWIDSAEITETTAGLYSGAAEFQVSGKYYSSAGNLQFTSNTDLTSGKAYVFAYLVPVGDLLD